MAELIDGKMIAKKLRDNLTDKVRYIKVSKGWVPTLAVVLVGDDPASLVYVSKKVDACHDIGISSRRFHLPENTTEEELLNLVSDLNADDNVDGILVQLPLPPHINKEKILLSIDPKKDVDGFHPFNMGLLFQGKPVVEPCTPKGIIFLLDYYNIGLKGKDIVIIGRSNIVGKPLAAMLLNKDATVSIVHSKTKDIKKYTKEADIVIVAVGKPYFLTGDMIKEGSVIVDVGINRLENGKLVGDVHFESVKDRASYITPVPGGVGPMTVAMLLENTVECALRRRNGD